MPLCSMAWVAKDDQHPYPSHLDVPVYSNHDRTKLLLEAHVPCHEEEKEMQVRSMHHTALQLFALRVNAELAVSLIATDLARGGTFHDRLYYVKT